MICLRSANVEPTSELDAKVLVLFGLAVSIVIVELPDAIVEDKLTSQRSPSKAPDTTSI